MEDRMARAYEAARLIVEQEMSDERRETLRRMGDSRVVVVEGTYDHVEDVLDVLGLGYRLVTPSEVGGLGLRPDQLLIVNCPGHLDRRGLTEVRRFVQQGGALFTTDWALRYVLEAAFPGVVAYNKRPTADEVVRIELTDQGNPFLEGVFHEGADPLWWLEGSSYPIKVLDASRVRVLIASKEIKSKYGEAPVAVTFREGKGEVFHMISHYYLQRAETRTDRHEGNWLEYAAQLGVPAASVMASQDLSDLKTGEVEAAHTKCSFMLSLMLEHERTQCK